MAAQIERGHDVAYFFTARHYARRPRPHVRRWERGGVAMHEVVNGPIVSGLELGTRHPELDIEEPWLEARFCEVIRAFRPEVVHVQELLCLPSSLIDLAADSGVATVMTLQDYLPLCSTLRLFDGDRRFCTRLSVGQDCAVRNAEAPRTRAPFVEDTLHFETARWRERLRVRGGPRARLFYVAARRVHERSKRRAAREPVPPALEGDALSEAFQRRRDTYVQRLARVDRLIPMSQRVADIYQARGVAPERMEPMKLTLAHIERLQPRRLEAAPSEITFVTLGGCAAETKGAHLISGALEILRERGFEGRFRLRVLGGVHHDVRGLLEGYRGVEIPELYDRWDLDELLDGTDVGIMPSIWEEAYGYSGVEMLAKGIPLIANPLGGMVEYAREGETAWLNRSCSAEGLAERMAMLIERPEEVLEMHRRVVGRRDEIVLGMGEHAEAIDGVYGDVARRATATEALP